MPEPNTMLRYCLGALILIMALGSVLMIVLGVAIPEFWTQSFATVIGILGGVVMPHNGGENTASGG